MDRVEQLLRERLRESQTRREDGIGSDFSSSWQAAKRRVSRRRRRSTALAGTAAVAALAFLALRPTGEEFRYIDTEELLETTSWSAPSDSLMPEHQVDIFRDLPVLIESTDTDGGALL